MAFWTQVIISTSGGGSITLAIPTSGAVDSSNNQFGFSSKPKLIVVDDATYRENHGWTWNSGTLTATTSISPTYDIYSIS